MENEVSKPPLAAPPSDRASVEMYEQVADKIGMIPNLRKSDNALQAVSVLAGMVLGGAVCGIVRWPNLGQDNDAPTPTVSLIVVDIFIGAVIGMAVATLVSGAYLMVRNARRR